MAFPGFHLSSVLKNAQCIYFARQNRSIEKLLNLDFNIA